MHELLVKESATELTTTYMLQMHLSKMIEETFNSLTKGHLD